MIISRGDRLRDLPQPVRPPVAAARLLGALEGLPDAQQVVLRLRFIEGQSAAQVAQALGTTEREVERRQMEALRALRAALTGHRVR
jgi:RNA polymerase sigma factor (sigma-70 family)